MQPMLWLEYSRKTMQAYGKVSKPLCAELGIPQTAFDILMFLANNPLHNTAKDIVERKRLKANLVSINVDKLVQEGYLDRKTDKSDRRRVLLFCTPKAEPIISKGLKLQECFYNRLLSNVPEDSIETMKAAIQTIFKNIDDIWRQEP